MKNFIAGDSSEILNQFYSDLDENSQALMNTHPILKVT